ncbi:MAG TPA: hypothetical protein VGN37_11085 [Actinocatenispora sp.]
MDTTKQVATPAPTRVRPGFVLAVRIVAIATAIVVLLQAVSAGLFVTGQVSFLDMHGYGAMAAGLLVIATLVTAILRWRPGGGTSQPVLMAVVELVLVVAQAGLGFSRVLALHIPLGVALFGVTLVYAVWACTPAVSRRGES